MNTIVHVTKSAAAYQELIDDTRVSIDTSTMVNVIPVDADLGIGRSIIFLRDGSSINVVESVAELYERGVRIS